MLKKSILQGSFLCGLKIVLIFFTLFITRDVFASSGDFAIYRDSLGGALTVDQVWDTTVQEDIIFSIDGNQTDINLGESGHYLFIYNLALESSDGTNRSEIQGIANLAGTNSAYGRATCFIRRASDAYECWMVGSGIIDVSANDTFKIISERTDSNLGAGVARRINESGVSILKLDDTWSFLRLQDSSGGQTFDNTTFEGVFWDTQDEIDPGAFSQSGADITFAQAGYYLVSLNLMFYNSSGSARRNNQIRLSLDGTEIPGTRTTAYLRGSNGAQDHAATWVGVIRASSDNQILRLESACEGEACGGVTSVGGQTAISIAKLPDAGNYIRLGELVGGQAVNATAEPVTWDMDYEIGSNFSHASNDSRVYVSETDDFLFFSSFYNYRSAPLNARLYPHWQWRKNGTDVQSFGSFGKYNRGDQSNTGTFSSGNSGAIILNNLNVGDFIELINTNETTASDASATFPSNTIAWQGFSLSSLFPSGPSVNLEQLNFRWRSDEIDLNSNGAWLANENNNLSSIKKSDAYRLRVRVANSGDVNDILLRRYELLWADKDSFSSCADIPTWNSFGQNESFKLIDSNNIDPDGEMIINPFLTNSESFVFIGGEGKDQNNISSSYGPLNLGEYLEFEYNIKATTEASLGHEYCFKLFDSENSQNLDEYGVYPELSIESVDTVKPILEWGYLDNVGDDSWSQINFSKEYTDPVFLCSLTYENNIGLEADGDADSVVCRVQNVSENGAEVILQVAGQVSPTLPANERIYWLVAESGDFENADLRMEAFKYNSTVTDTASSWVGEQQTYALSYVNPMVFGQVMTYNDVNWSSFWSYGASRTDPPSPTVLYTGKNVAEDTNVTRNDEILGVVVFEQVHNYLGSIEYEANISTQSIDRIDDTPPDQLNFMQSFSTTPEVAIVNQTGVAGGNGAHAVFYGSNPLTQAALGITVMEDEINDTEQTGALEYCSALAFASPGFYNFNYYLDQANFRFFENTDSVQPGSAIAEENAMISVDVGSSFRLRSSLQAQEVDLPAQTLGFKLEYGEGNKCSDISIWNEVGDVGSGEIWRGFDNTSVANGIQIVSPLLSGSDNLETYVEEGSSPVNILEILIGERSEWDFVLENNGAIDSAKYCFRMVTLNGDILNYTNYPQVMSIGSGGSLNVSVPEVASLGGLSFSFGPQDSINNNLGVVNVSDDRSGSPGWTLNLTGIDWSSGVYAMDYDGDGVSAGQLTADMLNAIITVNSGSSSGITVGSTDSFSSVNQVINLLTASPGNGRGDYDLENIELEQFVPAGQEVGNYNMTLVFTIS